MLGKDRSTIYRYEKGDIENLPLDILQPIATALITTPQYLMGWSDNTNSKPTPPDNESAGGLQKWIELYHKLSDNTRDMLINSLDEFDELTPEQQQLALALIRVALKNKK